MAGRNTPAIEGWAAGTKTYIDVIVNIPADLLPVDLASLLSAMDVQGVAGGISRDDVVVSIQVSVRLRVWGGIYVSLRCVGEVAFIRTRGRLN